MRRLMSMMRRERRLRLLFWGLLTWLFFLMTAASGIEAYRVFAPAHGLTRIETAQDAQKAADGGMSGALMIVPSSVEILGDYDVSARYGASYSVSVFGSVSLSLPAPDKNVYHAVLLSWDDYAVLLMTKGEITPGDEIRVGVRFPEETEEILVRFSEKTAEKTLAVFYDDVPDPWILTAILLGFSVLLGLIYRHFHGRRYLLRHTRFGREILALDEPQDALREMGREMRHPVFRGSVFILLEHWILYRRYEEEEKRWHYCPVEKDKVVSGTLVFLDAESEREDDDGPDYQWTLNELTRQHRIMLNGPAEARAAEAYLSGTQEKRNEA